MSHALEGQYRRLLRAYPQDYRRERGDEIIGTLMEAAAPDQRRPTVREAAALTLRGLQARVGAHRHRSRTQLWLGALRLAVLLLLTHATAVSVAHTGRVITDFAADGYVGLFSNLGYPLWTAFAVTALVAVARGRYATGLLATVAAFLTHLLIDTVGFHTDVDIVDGQEVFTVTPLTPGWIVDTAQFVFILPTTWPLPLAALMIIPLIRWRAPASARPLAWLLAVPVAVILLPTAFDATIRLQPWAPLAVGAGFLLWTAIDARASIAASALLLGPVLGTVCFYVVSDLGGSGPITVVWAGTYAIAALALLATGAVAAHRQTRI